MWLRTSLSRGQGSQRTLWRAVKHASSVYRVENNLVSGRLCACVGVCVYCRRCTFYPLSLLQSSRLVWWRMVEWFVQHQTSTTQGKCVFVWVWAGVWVCGGRCGIDVLSKYDSNSSSLQCNESSHYY